MHSSWLIYHVMMHYSILQLKHAIDHKKSCPSHALFISEIHKAWLSDVVYIPYDRSILSRCTPVRFVYLRSCALRMISLPCDDVLLHITTETWHWPATVLLESNFAYLWYRMGYDIYHMTMHYFILHALLKFDSRNLTRIESNFAYLWYRME